MNKKKILIIVLIVVTIFIIGLFCWQKNFRKVDKTEEAQSMVVQENVVDSKIEESKNEGEWETYKNDELGFEIDYLKSLEVIEGESGVSFVRDCSKKKEESFKAGHKCEVEGDLEIILYSGTINDFIENYKDACSEDICNVKIILQEEFVFNNIKATRLEGNSMEGSGVYNYVFIEKDNQNYLISYNYKVDEYETMITSFKFFKKKK